MNMNVETMNFEYENLEYANLQAVIVPFPAQSHVNALMNLAQLLAMRGFFITFVNMEWIHKRMVEVSAKKVNSLISLVSRGDPDNDNRGSKVRFLSIPDGLPPEHDRTLSFGEYFLALQQLSPTLEHLLRSSSGINDEKFPAVTCIVTDCFMSCTEQVATNMNVPRVIFWPVCAAFSITQCYAYTLLYSHGHIPVRITTEANSPEKLITCLPGNLPPLRPSDLSSCYRAEDRSDVLLNALLYESQKQSKGDYVLVNTFEELEGRDALEALSLNGCPALAIGPLFLPSFLQGRDPTTGLWEEEEESCLTWLDMQQPASVIYVSFGSLAVKSQEQLEQLALGLEGSGQPFLWVLRLDIAEGKPAVLPEGFEERTKERALIVRWAPQLKVLDHASVGLFLTHSGWNSTLESMSMGVPVLGFPYLGDQFLNCRFAKDVWEIGLDFEGVDVDDHKVVPKEEVENTVKRMMKTTRGEQLRQNAMKLKECAARAVLPGGSSFENLNNFVKDMISMKAAAQSKNETK